MLTRYGFGAIHIDDKKYEIRPTFQNIAKLGNPKEIIDSLMAFYNPVKFDCQYYRAVEILQACCEPKFPGSIVGTFEFLGNGTVKVNSQPNDDFIHDVIVLASHCLRYGVTGVTDEESSGQGEPIKEFDPYYFIGLACEHLGRTREQAADMTLTEFMMAWDIKFPEQKKEREERLSKQEQETLFAYQDELDRKAAQRRAAK